MTIDKEKRELFEDYSAGRIAPGQFATTGLTLGGIIIVFLTVIAFTLFWDSPGQAKGNFINGLQDIEAETAAHWISASINNARAGGLMYLADQTTTVTTMNVGDIEKYLYGYGDLYHKENISFKILSSSGSALPKFAVIYDLKNIDPRIKKFLAQKARENNYKDAQGKLFTEKANAIYFEGTTYRGSP